MPGRVRAPAARAQRTPTQNRCRRHWSAGRSGSPDPRATGRCTGEVRLSPKPQNIPTSSNFRLFSGWKHNLGGKKSVLFSTVLRKKVSLFQTILKKNKVLDQPWSIVERWFMENQCNIITTFDGVDECMSLARRRPNLTICAGQR